MRLSLVLLISLFVGRDALIYNQRCTQCIVIDVFFHATSYDDGTILVRNEKATAPSIASLIKDEMKIINQEFSETPFNFRWMQELPTSTINSTDITMNLCSRRDATELTQVIVGNTSYRSLNVFLGHEVYSDSTEIQGCADMPFYNRYPAIYIQYEELPPEPTSDIPVFAHEIGHWLGLFHPDFSGFDTAKEDSCDVRNINDFVWDTAPLNSSSLEVCPTYNRSVSNTNIMNKYCKTAFCPEDQDYLFSEGQVQRMYQYWLLLYEQGERCTRLQRRFSVFLPAFSIDQVIVYDQSGEEILNAYEIHLMERWNDLTIDFCLRRNETYVVVLVSGGVPTQVEFQEDGARIEEEFQYLGGFLDSFVLESSSIQRSTADAEYGFTISALSGITLGQLWDSGCSSDEWLLHVTSFDEWEWVAVFSEGSDAMWMTDSSLCVAPQLAPITVLVATLDSSAPSLQVKLNGNAILQEEWPYFELFGTFRIFSALIPADNNLLLPDKDVNVTRKVGQGSP